MEGDKIASNLKSYRTERGVTQTQLANAVFVSPKSIANYEKNIEVPSLITAYRIASYLKADVTDIFPYYRLMPVLKIEAR